MSMNLLVKAVGDNSYDDVVKLLREGVDPKHGDASGIVLHHAVWKDSVEISNLLISAYPEGIYSVDANGNTPLHDATYTMSFKCCELLLRHGSEANATNLNGQRPIHRLNYSDYGQSYRWKFFRLFADYGETFKSVRDSEGFSAQLCARNQTRDAVLFILAMSKHRARCPLLFRVVGKDMLRLIALELWENRWTHF